MHLFTTGKTWSLFLGGSDSRGWELACGKSEYGRTEGFVTDREEGHPTEEGNSEL